MGQEVVNLVGISQGQEWRLVPRQGVLVLLSVRRLLVLLFLVPTDQFDLVPILIPIL